MKKRRKRILCAVLSVLLVVTSFRVAPMQRVEAAALAVEASDELAALLWNFCANCMIIDGVERVIESDYETEKTLFEAFLQFMGMQEHSDLGNILLSDGTYVNTADIFDGTGALEIPTEEEWAEFRVIDGGGGSSEEPGEDPEEPEEAFFTHIQQIIISSEFINDMVDFGLKLWNGEIEGVDLSLYYDKSYTGEVRTDGVCYLYDMAIVNYYGYEYSVEDYLSDCLLCGCIEETTNMVYIYKFGVNGSAQIAPCGGYSGTSNYPYYSGLQALYTDIPLFSSREEALNYYETGDDTGCLNGLCYDFPGLVNSLLEVLHPLTGVSLNPSAIPGLQQALLNAYANLPAPGTDPVENTENYKAAMKEAVEDYAEVMPEPEPLPDSVVTPEPEPEPDPEPETETSSEDVNDYKVELSTLFPFCIPFDFIALLDALDAEPEAPSFEIPFVVPALEIDERYEVDLSMFDEQMEVVRTFETIGFIVLLMHLTSKFIKW